LSPDRLTLELMVLLGEPLNFANVIAMPLLIGVGAAFKIYTSGLASRSEPTCCSRP